MVPMTLAIGGSNSSSGSSYSNAVKRTRRSPLPSGFTKVDSGTPLSDDTMMDLRIGLKAADNQGLERRLYAASTPGSAEYGKWLDREEVGSNINYPSQVSI